MENVCIPIHLDAFALSVACCNENLASRIAPYTQPNYTALRLDSHLLQRDVLENIDFHNTQPASSNPRIANIGLPPSKDAPNSNIKLNRTGVHLQWSLPRLYRTATADGRDSAINNAQNEVLPPGAVRRDPTQPVFRQIPNRWLVVRRLKSPRLPKGVNEFQSWVVESDAVQNITKISTELDLESDMSPFVQYKQNPDDPNVLNYQTEVFLGQKFDLDNYSTAGARTYMDRGVTVMTSSNMFFPDYALHNTNVLSIIDNFGYRESPGSDIKYMHDAVCDYFVIGWHTSVDADPLKANGTSLKERLQHCMLKLNPSLDVDLHADSHDASGAFSLRDSTDGSRCLLHGAVYDVRYNLEELPKTTLVENAAAKFTSDWKMEPVSVGTTSLDSVMTFLEAHKQDPADSAVKEFGEQGKDLVQYIIELGQLLYAAGDDYDSRVQAQDLIAEQNFSKSEGGTRWTYASDNIGGASLSTGKPRIPADSELASLAALNEAQLRLDVATRKLKGLRWSLFAEWFKYRSEYTEKTSLNSRIQHYRTVVSDILSKIVTLERLVQNYQDKVKSLQSGVNCKSSARDPFHQRTDPTLCIAGLDSGWPVNTMDNGILVRMDSELTKDATDLQRVNTIFARSSNPITTNRNLQNTALKLLAECLKDTNARTENGKSGSPSITGFQAWGDKNPFAPLFIEWECMYYHIDKKYWDIKLRPSPVGHSHSQVRYGLKDLLVTGQPGKDQHNAMDNQNNFRKLSGRIPILPQPRFDLESIVLQVLDSKSPDLPSDITPDVMASLRKNLSQLKFITAPLSGMTNHLLTRCEGAHVRPNVRNQGEFVPLSVAAAPEIGMNAANLLKIDGESALTPYGSLLPFRKDDYAHNPFKPVTHGQFMFTQLNVIDKFGQAICLPQRHLRKVIEPNPPEAAIHPCLSDYLTPEVVKSSSDDKAGTLNTVFPAPRSAQDGEWPLCPYIQLTPSINQNARINGAFLTRDTITSPWREVSDYESPIWGWIVINYADNGLQFFLGDGTFYREIRRGGVFGTNLSARWIPYGQPPVGGEKGFDRNNPAVVQLDALIGLFTSNSGGDPSYLEPFANMINGAIQNMPFPPSAYAGYANAIVGKPLALVNAGWSIELAEPPIEPQFDSIDQKPGEKLWPNDPELLDYDFPLKIGDAERNYDGVVGFYCSSNPTPSTGPNTPSPTPSTDWKTMFSYFPPEEQPKAGGNQFADASSPDNFLSLKPYYIDPDNEKDVPDMTKAKVLKYTVTSVLMDPYTAIHGYSPILPTKVLKLSPWTIQTAMDQMQAFFRLGPYLVVDDVPSTYATASAPGLAGGVKLPVGGTKGTWSWLQPYEQFELDKDGKKNDLYESDGNVKGAQFAEMGVQEDQGTIKFEPAPYTFLEGYLRLTGRLQGK